MIRDTFESMTSTARERIGNPFLATAAIALFALNWKLLLLIGADFPYDEKVARAIALYPDLEARLYSFILYPAAVGLAWLVAWPVANLGLTAYWQFAQAKIHNVRLMVQRTKHLSEAAAAALYSALDEQDSKYHTLLSERQQRISSLTKELEDAHDAHAELAKSREATISGLNSNLHNLSVQNKNLEEEAGKLKNSVATLERQAEESRREGQRLITLSNGLASHLVGLREFTEAISLSPNFRADESWLRETLRKKIPTLSSERYRDLLQFYVALGLLEEDHSGHIGFGSQYRTTKDLVLRARSRLPPQDEDF